MPDRNYRNADWMRDQLEAGASPGTIASECDVTRSTIYNWAARHGIDLDEYRDDDPDERSVDHGNITIPLVVEDSDLVGLDELRRRKERMGVTWIEFVNEVAPDHPPGSVDLNADAIAEQVAASVDGDSGEADIRKAVADAIMDATDDIEQAAFEGAKRGVEEAAYQ